VLKQPQTGIHSSKAAIMVQGLAFLSKKSWHTKNIANQERVWIEEQKKEAEGCKDLL
jgi:hypothetical protein